MENLCNKLVKLNDNVYYIPSSTNVGVIIDGLEVYLIDSGNTEIDGEYILDSLSAFFGDKKSEYKIKAIINTHSHADHCGGNNFIQEKTKAEIWLPLVECGSIENPLLQGALIWGGYPPHQFRTAYYKAETFTITKRLKEEDIIKLSNGDFLSFINLPGHYFENFAVIYNYQNGEKIVFAGDAIFERFEIGKYWIPFMIHPNQFMESLDKLCNIENLKILVPGHGNPIQGNLAEEAELDKIAIISTKLCIKEVLKSGPLTTEEILKKVADKNEINMRLGQYVLIGSTLRSYLAVMHDEGELKVLVENNNLYWSL